MTVASKCYMNCVKKLCFKTLAVSWSNRIAEETNFLCREEWNFPSRGPDVPVHVLQRYSAHWLFCAACIANTNQCTTCTEICHSAAKHLSKLFNYSVRILDINSFMFIIRCLLCCTVISKTLSPAGLKIFFSFAV